jgi:PhnB protein
MAHEPSQSTQKIVPYLAYADAEAALTFLERAFGFVEVFRFPMPDGRIGHAEVALGDNVLMLASTYPELGFASPQELGSVHSQVFCYVDDVDAHYARSRAAGAVVVDEPRDTDHGDRSYRAMDPEGHRWMFSTRTSGTGGKAR